MFASNPTNRQSLFRLAGLAAASFLFLLVEDDLVTTRSMKSWIEQEWLESSVPVCRQVGAGSYRPFDSDRTLELEIPGDILEDDKCVIIAVDEFPGFSRCCPIRLILKPARNDNTVSTLKRRIRSEIGVLVKIVRHRTEDVRRFLCATRHKIEHELKLYLVNS